MFSQVTRKIYGMESDIATANSRISQCENSIYRIKEDVYDISPLSDKFRESDNKIDILNASVIELTAVVEQLQSSLEIMQANIAELQASIGPKADVQTVNPKHKTDLEIFKQNDENGLDPFITPQYYLDERKNDYWYWNGDN